MFKLIIIQIVFAFALIGGICYTNSTKLRKLEQTNQNKIDAIMSVSPCNVQLRSYQIDVYDEHGTNDSIRIYDGDRLVGKVCALDSTAFNNIINKDNE